MPKDYFDPTRPAISEAEKAAKLIEIDHRWKDRKKDRTKHKRGPISLATLRVAQLRKLFQARYEGELPDDDAGRDDAKIMAHHIAQRPRSKPYHIEQFLRQWCPWMDAGERTDIVNEAITNPVRWSADDLADKLGLTNAERSKHRLTTIGATDLPKSERQARRDQRSRQRKRDHRASQRVAKQKPTRAEWEAASISRAKPWEALGMSRRTWYRRDKPQGTVAIFPQHHEKDASHGNSHLTGSLQSNGANTDAERRLAA